MPSLGFPLQAALGGDGDSGSVTLDQARSAIVALFPPGKLYDFENPDADIYKHTEAIAKLIKKYGFDIIDTVRTEFDPSLCVQKLPDWEGALGIGNDKRVNITSPANSTRQASIVSKLREYGGSTLNNIRSIVGPILDYADNSTLTIIECNRSTLTSNHNYIKNVEASIPASGTVTQTIWVPDSGVVSDAGVRIQLILDHAGTGNLQVSLSSPPTTSTTVTWSVTAGNKDSQYTYYYSKDFVGVPIMGTWTLKIVNDEAATTGSLYFWYLFVEGIGVDGLGGNAYEWGVYADSAKVGAGADYRAAWKAIQRINPAYAIGYLIKSINPIPDDNSASIPDQCIPV